MIPAPCAKTIRIVEQHLGFVLADRRVGSSMMMISLWWLVPGDFHQLRLRQAEAVHRRARIDVEMQTFEQGAGAVEQRE